MTYIGYWASLTAGVLLLALGTLVLFAPADEDGQRHAMVVLLAACGWLLLALLLK